MRYVVLIMLLLANSAIAGQLAEPTGEVILTISGNITLSNSEQGAEFDLAMLEQLAVTSIATQSPWTDDKTVFTGVRLDVLLDAVGANSSAFRAVALDGYWYDITDIDLQRYPVVLAYQRNQEYMSARNLGPLWIMFPFDDHPELLTEANKAACVWQLNSLVVL